MRGNLGLLLVAVAAALAVGGMAAAKYPSRARLTAAPSGWTTDGTTTSTTQRVKVLGPGALTATAIGPSGDENTGVNFPAGDTINVVTNGVLRQQWAAATTYFIGTEDHAGVVGGSVASGSVQFQSLTGAKTCLGSAGVGCLTYQTASTSLEQSLGVGTAGSGTGITVVSSGALRPFVHKVTVAFGAMTAAATTDITLWTLPAKARLSRVVADYTVVFAGGAITDVDVTCGKTAGANEYLVTHDVDTAIGTYGVAAAEIGASLLSATAADVNWATQAVICRFTCAGANCNAATTGSATYYLEGVSYP